MHDPDDEYDLAHQQATPAALPPLFEVPPFRIFKVKLQSGSHLTVRAHLFVTEPEVIKFVEVVADYDEQQQPCFRQYTRSAYRHWMAVEEVLAPPATAH